MIKQIATHRKLSKRQQTWEGYVSSGSNDSNIALAFLEITLGCLQMCLCTIISYLLRSVSGYSLKGSKHGKDMFLLVVMIACNIVFVFLDITLGCLQMRLHTIISNLWRSVSELYKHFRWFFFHIQRRIKSARNMSDAQEIPRSDTKLPTYLNHNNLTAHGHVNVTVVRPVDPYSKPGFKSRVWCLCERGVWMTGAGGSLSLSWGGQSI